MNTDSNFKSRLPKNNLYTDQLSKLNDQILPLFLTYIEKKIKMKFHNKHDLRKCIQQLNWNYNKNFTLEKNFFLALKHYKGKVRPKTETLKDLEYRAQYKANQIKKLLMQDKDEQAKDVADIGCADGIISKKICETCFPKAHLYMFDPYVKENTQYKSKVKSTFYNTPFKRSKDKYDVIIMITSLHHVMTPLQLIKDIYFSLKPGGYFILREHQPMNDQQKMFLDLMEKAWAISFNNEAQYSEYENKKALQEAYFTRQELMSLLKKFKLINNFREEFYETNAYPEYFLFQKE